MGPLVLVSSLAHRDLDPDAPLLIEALAGLGIAAEVWAWDESHDWSTARAAVIRSPWDYTERLPEFLAWAEAAAAQTELANPIEMLRWNTDKRYLGALADLGVPVVPTRYVAPGDAVVVPAEWEEVVVKPTVSAGGRNTGRFSDHASASVFARSLLERGHHVMVQPHIAAVDTDGEIDVITFRGEFSHAVRKGAILHPDATPADDLRLAEGQEITAAALDGAPLELVAQVLDAVVAAGVIDAPPLYARIDCVQLANGTPVLMEAELAEPCLFLERRPGSERTAAAAIATWLDERGL